MKRRMFHDAIHVLEQIEASPPDEHTHSNGSHHEHWSTSGDHRTSNAGVGGWGRSAGVGGHGTASSSMFGSSASAGNGSGNSSYAGTPSSRDRRSSMNASIKGSEGALSVLS